MAIQAGILNVGGFLLCHRFVTHVTGYGTFFGIEISQLDYGAALGMLLVPLFFLFGSMASGFLVDVPIKLAQRPRYYLAFIAISLLIGVVFLGGILGYFGNFESGFHSREYLLLAVLCMACGIQNGTITTVSKSVIRTTHLTGITTDLGIGLTRMLNQRRLGKLIEGEARANLMRVGIILSFGLGSIIGAFLFQQFEYWGFLLPLLSSGGLALLMYNLQMVKSDSGNGSSI